MAEHRKDASLRKAQHLLAREFVELVHGEEEAADAEQQHRAIFRKAPLLVAASKASKLDEGATSRDRPITSTNAPSVNVTLPASLVIDQPLAKVLYSAGLVASRAEGHRLAVNQGAYVGSRANGSGGMSDAVEFAPIKNWDPSRTKDFILDGNLLVLRVGKWKVKIARVVSDDEFQRLGLDVPGWRELEESRNENRRGSVR